MANVPPSSWNNSLSSPLPTATPGQMGMEIAMKSMFNAGYQLPSRNSNFERTVNTYQDQCSPFNAHFIPNIPCPPSGFHQNLHGGQAFPANGGCHVTGMMNYPRNPIIYRETTMNTEQHKHNHRHNFQIKTCNKPCSPVMAQRQMFSCDACEKDFSSKVTFHSHLDAHMKCEFEGCNFQATQKVLKMHRAQAHSSKSCNIQLDTPEDIAKWKEERKRNYPTVSNILRKKDEEENRKAAGNILNTTSYRYKSNFEKQQSHKRGRRDRRGNHRNGNIWKRNQRHLPREVQNQEISSSSTSKQSTEDYPVENDLNQDGLNNSSKLLNKTCSKNATSAINLLAASYGDISSEDETNEDENNNGPALKIKESSSRIHDVKSGLPSKKIKTASTSSENSGKRGKRKRKERVPQNNCNKKPTLLEMLLAPEVRHERNVILQCIRHIVKHNFFDNVTE